ncbi:MAG: MBL fold metallo-hydrolase [Clostridia bacterium]|nr:MBL fold metallo-hydrolase [Clostridia bacterium]
MADFYLLGNSTYSQMFGCVIQTETKTVVIDGGSFGDTNQLADFLREKANSHVDAWFFTHPHHDHIGSFYGIRRSSPDITVDNIYHCFPSTESLKQYGARNDDEKRMWEDIDEWSLSYNVHKLSPKERFSFDDVSIQVLRVFNPNMLNNFVNNSSAVYRIENANKSFLILGDLGVEGGYEVMESCPLELLIADYTQMAHHGQGGVDRKFYEYIKLKRCIWASPDWLWNNDTGNGFDTARFQTVKTRKWAEELGVTEHFIEKDGTQKIEF